VGTVQLGGRRIELDGCVPKPSNELHPLGVVPDVGADRPTGPDGPAELRDRELRLRDEVQDETGDGGIRRSVRHGEGARVRDLKRGASVGDRSARVLNVRVGQIDAEDSLRIGELQHGLRQSAGPASDV
jgi:hypothetical protein